MAKRFGCLAYSKIMVPNGPLANKAEKCIFLGMSTENSAWLLGTFRKDARTRGGLRFVVLESKSARFAQNILIDSLNRLRPDHKGFTVPDNEIEKWLGDLERPVSPVVPPALPSDLLPSEKQVNGDSGIDTTALDSAHTPAKTDDEVRDLLDGFRTSDDESEEPPLKKQKLDASDPPIAKRKRGRPRGSKNKTKGPTSSTSNSSTTLLDKGGAGDNATPSTGPKSETSTEPDVVVVKRSTRARARATRGTAKVSSITQESVNLILDDFRRFEGQNFTLKVQSGQTYTVATSLESNPTTFEDGEEEVCWNIQLTRAKVLKAPDREKYFE
jgi:hypothetical protein